MGITQFPKERIHLPRAIDSTWTSDLKESFLTVDELLKSGFVNESDFFKLKSISDSFRIRVSKYYASLIKEKGDPIWLQAIPSIHEIDLPFPNWAKEFSLEAFGKPSPWIDDAIGDIEKLSAPRLTHRYDNRAIVHISSMCSTYCRFCFRKTHLNDSDRTLYDGALDSTIEYLKNNPAIEEVIFTGGDPLMLNDISLQNTLERFLNIDSIKILRLHSRVPVTLPSRLNLELKNILRNTIDFYKKQILVVTHFNHPNELSAFALNQIQNFQKSGIQFSNQSVLLKNVNDSVVTLKNLFQTLYVNGINTLYLHHPDLTKGTNYFRTSIMRGQNLVRELQGKVSSGAFPHYVLDVPGGLGKISLLDSHRIKLKKSFSDKENNLGADFYEINTIETAEQKPQQVNYADFFSLSIS